jgi:hypothetical protein
MMGKIIISCCYEHCFLSVRQGEVVETEGKLLRRSCSSPSWIHGQELVLLIYFLNKKSFDLNG